MAAELCKHDLEFCGECAELSIPVLRWPQRAKKGPLNLDQRQRVIDLVERYARHHAAGVRDRVMRKVHGRLAALEVDWPDPRHRRPLARFAGGPLRVVETTTEELIIFHALATTGDARQYAVTQRAEVFRSAKSGFTYEEARELYVTELSPLIEEVGLLFWAFRGGDGGRMYIDGNLVRDAKSDRHVLEIRDVEAM